jgi:uncharacterized membrane protein YdbT with pleckstrin-like domain
MKLQEQFTKNLKEGETLIAVVRPFALVYVVPILVTSLVVLLDFFFLFWFVRHGKWGVLAFLVILVIGIILSLRTAYLWIMNAFIVTNQRVIDIDQSGFFNRRVSESTYEKIQDISFTVRGVWATLFRYGSVVLQTAGTNAQLELKNVRWPERVQSMIVEAQRQRLASVPGDREGETDETPDALDLESVVRTIRGQVGEKDFDRLVKKTRPRGLDERD